MAMLHRYKSEIHGNYRRAYLRAGATVGGVLTLYLVGRYVAGYPVERVTGYVGDIILLVLEFLFVAYYRKSLPDEKMTLKESLLFGMGMAVVAAAIYGVGMSVLEMLAKTQVVLFCQNMMEKTITTADPQIGYWAVMWAMVGAVQTAVLGAFGAFVASVVFRNEKATVYQTKTKQNTKQ